MAYFRFFFTHPRVLPFGVLFKLFSSFGQTFLISIFMPRLLETFALNTAQFGAVCVGGRAHQRPSVPVSVANHPIMNEPVTFTSKVPQGKVSPNWRATKPEAPNRATPPSPLPRKIKK